MTHTMAGTDTARSGRSLNTSALVPGVLGGLAGGLAFGLMMQTMDMLPMVAMMVGSESVVVGWVVHLVISAVLGAGFGLVGSRLLGSWLAGILGGIGYGMVWWVLGALIAMPARLGMPLLTLDATAWNSLMGHVIFGAILGAVSVAILRRRM